MFVLLALQATTWQATMFFYCMERVLETAGTVGGYSINKLEVVAPRYAGALQAWTNGLAAVSGMVAIRMAAVIVEWTGGWGGVFFLIACVYAIAAIAYQRLASSDRVLQ